MTTGGLQVITKITDLVKSHAPLIYVVSDEEQRLTELLVERVAEPLKRAVYRWSCFRGLQGLKSTVLEDKTDSRQLPDALKVINNLKLPSNSRGGIFLMYDAHCHLTPIVARQLRDIYFELIQGPDPKVKSSPKTIIFISGILAHTSGGIRDGLEPSLKTHVEVVDFPLPARSELVESINLIMEPVVEAEEARKKAGKPGTKKRVDYSPDEIQTFSRSLQGLSLIESGRAISECFYSHGQLDAEALLWKKRQIVRRDDILEVISDSVSMNNVGGLDEIKKFIDMYVDQFSDGAEGFGVDPIRGIILAGVPGCLGGDTIIQYNRGSRAGYRKLKLKTFYKRFNKFHKNWSEDLVTYTYSFDMEGKVVRNRILGVLESGKKQVLTLSTKKGRNLTLTPDHPVCITSIEDGVATHKFVPANELKVGQQILCQGSMKPRKNGGKRIPDRSLRKFVETLKYHPIASEHIVNGCVYQRCTFARLVVEAHMNSMSPEELVKALQTNEEKAKTLKYLPSNYDVHHLDENQSNDKLENLMILEHDEHSRLHSKLCNFNVDYLDDDFITEIKDAGVQMTYDIQMDYPHNNFVANGIVVHNCGKSLLAKAIGSYWKLPVLRLDIGRVMGGIVGSSEANMRAALKTLEAASPVVCWLDEIEKALSGTASSGMSDGGTLSRVFGTLLTAMEERMKGVVFVATANDVSALPPELIRRFNEVFFVDLPKAQERKTIFEIHLAKRGRDLEKVDVNLDYLVSLTKGFTGSEIEKAVKEGIARAWRNKLKDVNTESIELAIRSTKPISDMMKDKIQKLQEWAKSSARSASSFTDEAVVVEPGKISNLPNLTMAEEEDEDEAETGKNRNAN